MFFSYFKIRFKIYEILGFDSVFGAIDLNLYDSTRYSICDIRNMGIKTMEFFHQRYIKLIWCEILVALIQFDTILDFSKVRFKISGIRYR